MGATVGRLYLGIDGGGSSTSALLARSDVHGWSSLGRGQAGPSNLAVGEAEAALENVQAAIEAAFRQASLPRQRVWHACLALAGSDRASVRQTLDQWLTLQPIASEWTIVHDAQPLLAWAANDEAAIALIGGTGSLAWGRNALGQSARAGGWGPLLGDEGSGYWIALQGLRAVVCQTDHRGPPTTLATSLPAGWRLDDVRQWPTRVRSIDRRQIAALAPWVAAAAVAGDAVAGQILSEAGTHLALLVQAVARQIGVAPTLDRLAFTGGVLLHCPELVEQVTTRLRQQGLSIAALDRIDDPTRGAVELAHRAASR